MYSSNSNASLLSLRQCLQQVSEGTKTISEYIADVFEIVGNLAMAEETTTEFDKVLYMLVGLGDEFKSFV